MCLRGLPFLKALLAFFLYIAIYLNFMSKKARFIASSLYINKSLKLKAIPF